jgi:hypothetical protein
MLCLFFIFLCFSIGASEFSGEIFLKNLRRPTPKWIEQQIAEDLEPYREGFFLDDIDATWDGVNRVASGYQAGLSHFKIKNNEINCLRTTLSKGDARVEAILHVVRSMTPYAPLPDMEFLVATWDSYDNPLYLEQTFCPVFAICKLKSNHRAVLIPEFRHFDFRHGTIKNVKKESAHLPWSQKVDQAIWRGVTSGHNYHLNDWDLKPRSRLVLFSKEHPDLLDAGFTGAFSISKEVERKMEEYNLFVPWVYAPSLVSHKYQIAIDGNTFASSFWWQLLSNCAVLKSNSDYMEWFYQGLEPNVHYMPFEPDLSDLEKKLRKLMDDPPLAKKIADKGTEFAEAHLSNEALAAFFHKLLTAYAKLQRK